MDKTLVFDSGAGNCGCSPLEAAALSNGGFGGANAMLPAMMMGGGFGGFGGGYEFFRRKPICFSNGMNPST